MPLTTAQKFAWNLATTLMTVVVLLHTPDGYSVMTEAEFDGDPAEIFGIYDPFSA